MNDEKGSKEVKMKRELSIYILIAFQSCLHMSSSQAMYSN